jgi:hypothetical protein
MGKSSGGLEKPIDVDILLSIDRNDAGFKIPNWKLPVRVNNREEKKVKFPIYAKLDLPYAGATVKITANTTLASGSNAIALQPPELGNAFATNATLAKTDYKYVGISVGPIVGLDMTVDPANKLILLGNSTGERIKIVVNVKPVSGEANYVVNGKLNINFESEQMTLRLVKSSSSVSGLASCQKQGGGQNIICPFKDGLAFANGVDVSLEFISKPLVEGELNKHKLFMSYKFDWNNREKSTDSLTKEGTVEVDYKSKLTVSPSDDFINVNDAFRGIYKSGHIITLKNEGP